MQPGPRFFFMATSTGKRKGKLREGTFGW